MSEQNVEVFKRGIDAGNRRDFDAVLADLDPEVEWHPGLIGPLEGQPTVYRGREGVREWFEQVDEVLGDVHMDFPEIRDLGDRILAIGHIRMRGEVSGAETESPMAYLIDYKNAKATRVRSYLDPQEALEAAGLLE